MRIPVLLLLLLMPLAHEVSAQRFDKEIEQKALAIESKVISWRHEFHEFPELSNREFETGKKIAAHLKSLGLEVKEKVAHTGVVGILRTGKPGPVIALRADIDALPVTERTDVPFKSTVKGEYNGQEVGVMHACGHDTHIAILMGVAEILTGMKSKLKGTIVFIFQPAEEGAPEGEEGGASLMVKEGVLDDPKVDAIFGLHINAQTEVGTIKYKAGGIMAAADILKIKIEGKQTHGSTPWTGVDPIVASAQIINGLQTVISRQSPLTEEAAVVTIGAIHGGVRNNIIPEQVDMIGTIRTLDKEMQADIHRRVKNTAEMIAASSGAKATVEIQKMTPVTYNDPALTERMLPTLRRVAGADHVKLMKAVTGAEDFAYYQEKVPGMFFFIGGMPKGQDPATAAPHHTPDFYVDDSGMLLGIKAMSILALDFLGVK